MRKGEMRKVIMSTFEILFIVLLGVSLIYIGMRDYRENHLTVDEILEIVEEDIPLDQLPFAATEAEEIESELPDIYSLSIVNPVFEPYDIPLDSDVQEHFFDMCCKYEVNPWLMLALMESESSYIVDSKGDWTEDGYGNPYYRSYGLMQINQVNWDRMSESYGLDIFNVYDNIEAGIIIYCEGTGETFAQSIMNYKCGKGRATELLNQGIILKCVQTIADRAVELEQKHRRDL